jgi:hypothetical protein
MPKKDKPPPLRLEYRTAAELADNPGNWRKHPKAQTRALADALAEVGWAGACLYNERTKRLIDGHARKSIAGKGERIPVLVGSWTPEQEAKILATLDPLASMAQTDGVKLSALLEGVNTDSEALGALLDGMRSEHVAQAAGRIEKAPVTRPPDVVWILIAVPTKEYGAVQKHVAALEGHASLTVQVTREAR